MNARAHPSVSVVIPVFNGADLLADAVESVRSQTMQPVELIIVDDGSTDDTPAVARRLGAGIKYVAQTNRGPAATRNYGLGLCRGECVGFLDVDDLWTADNLAMHAEALADNPESEFVIGRTRIVDLPGAGQATYRFERTRAMEPQHFFMIGASLFRRSAFETVGLFDESKRFGEDLDWFVRARERGTSFRLTPHPGHIVRRHAHNQTRGKSAVEMGISAVLRESLLRRRKVGVLAATREDLPRA